MEANIAYYCLHKLHKWSHEFLALNRYERAYVIAAIKKIKNDKKAERSIKRNGNKKKG